MIRSERPTLRLDKGCANSLPIPRVGVVDRVAVSGMYKTPSRWDAPEITCYSVIEFPKSPPKRKG